MAKTYQHSDTIANLKGIKETIQGNPTTYQLLSTLDDMLYDALLPLVDGTRFLDTWIAQVLGWQTSNPKRKVTGVGRAAFSSYATLFLLLESPKAKIKVLRRMKIDRGVLFEAIRRWLGTAEAIEAISTLSVKPENFQRLYDLAEICNVRQGSSLLNIYRQVYYWHAEAAKFKSQILEKYTRLCINTAVRDYKEMNHSVELNDIVQTYLLTADKAINKCDADRGVLTSHIQNWLLSAKNTVMADNMQPTPSARSNAGKNVMKGLAESVPLEEIEDLAAADASEAEETDHTVSEVRIVARQFDPQGIGRILLNIEDVLCEDDLMALRAHALVPHEPPAKKAKPAT